jgi:hypothetical protein
VWMCCFYRMRRPPSWSGGDDAPRRWGLGGVGRRPVRQRAGAVGCAQEDLEARRTTGMPLLIRIAVSGVLVAQRKMWP